MCVCVCVCVCVLTLLKSFIEIYLNKTCVVLLCYKELGCKLSSLHYNNVVFIFKNSPLKMIVVHLLSIFLKIVVLLCYEKLTIKLVAT
jgi:hypothetical protein